MIEVNLTKAQFVQLVRVLDGERTSLRDLAKSQTLSEENRAKYRRELYDMNGLLAAVLDEDADEYDEPV